MSDRTSIVLIIGVGRSGTSAIARTMSLCGCVQPGTMLAGADLNPRGSWEPADIWRMNHKFMLRHGSDYLDPTMRLQEIPIDKTEREQFINEVEAFLQTCPKGDVLTIKQPDITEVLDFWIEAACRRKLSVKFIIPIRHPQEVFSSVATVLRQSGMTISVELSNAFWLRRNLIAEQQSRNYPRVYVDYKNFLGDWRHEINRISKSLAVPLNPDEGAIDDFLTLDLHRQRSTTPIAETFGYAWMTKVYAILSDAARDAPLDLDTLDEIFKAYRENERAFRIARDQFKEWLSRLEQAKFREHLDQIPVWRAGQDF